MVVHSFGLLGPVPSHTFRTEPFTDWSQAETAEEADRGKVAEGR